MNDPEKKQEEDINFYYDQEGIVKLREKRKAIEEEVKRDILIYKEELIDQCRHAPNVVQKYLEILSSYRRLLDKHRMVLEQKESEWFLYYKSMLEKKGHKFGDRFPRDFNSTDAKRMISREPDYIKTAVIVNELKDFVDHLSDTVKNFRDRNYQIKNMIDLMKLDMGVSG